MTEQTGNEKNTAGDARLPIEAARETLTVRRAFGEAYEADGATVIPVAKVMGGSGMGFGDGDVGGDNAERQGAHLEGSGGGGGFGTRVKPVGVYAIRDGQVSWQPAIDVNRAIIGGQIVVAAAIVAYACVRRARHRARRWDTARSRRG